MSLINYMPGENIITNCKHLIKISKKIPGTSFVEFVCEECFTSPEDNPNITLKACSGCSLVSYCSETCKMKDWQNGHMIECGSKTFANNFNPLHSESTLNTRCQIFRAMTFLAMHPEESERQFDLYTGKSRCFNDLMSHDKCFATGPVGLICDQMADEIQEEKFVNPKHSELLVSDVKYLVKLGGILQTNAFTITNDEETKEIGSGICVQASIFDHSCKPTALFHSKASGVEVRAIAPIAKGEEPYISYISAIAGKAARQEYLKERYNFECLCDLCSSAEEENINYPMLNRLINFASTCEQIPHQDLLKIHKNVVHILQKIYHRYDLRITNQFSRTLLALLSNEKFVKFEQSTLNELIQETKDQVKITFGEDHPEFLKIDVDPS